MASHVPFLAVRPDDQFSSDLKPNGSTERNVEPSTLARAMNVNAPSPASRLPAWVRFPLVCILSYGLAALMFSLAADITGYELAAVMREPTEETLGAVLGWKFVQLCTAWYAGYDWKDLASLAVLSNLPYFFLLTTFYGVSTFAAATALAIDVSEVAIAFALLRPLIHAHQSADDDNQIVAQDSMIFFLTALLGASIYFVVTYFSFCTWLPVYLIKHFDGVRSVQHAHEPFQLLLVLTFIPVGLATAQFLYVPSIGSRGNPGMTDPDSEDIEFDPETATFLETVAYNLGFQGSFTSRAEVLAKRAAVLIVCSVANTFARVLLTVDGTNAVGAAGWASVWGLAAMLTSVAYGFVVNE